VVRIHLLRVRLQSFFVVRCMVIPRTRINKNECSAQRALLLCSMRGSNPRPLAHKTNTLPTELMEHVCRSWLPASLTVIESRVRGLVVMIVACQVMDPGSIPGERIFFCPCPACRARAVGTSSSPFPDLFEAGGDHIFDLPCPSTSRTVIACSPHHTQAKKKEKRSAQPESNQ
jgi:hypothetical protein